MGVCVCIYSGAELGGGRGGGGGAGCMYCFRGRELQRSGGSSLPGYFAAVAAAANPGARAGIDLDVYTAGVSRLSLFYLRLSFVRSSSGCMIRAYQF